VSTTTICPDVILAVRATVSLEELEQLAALQTRTDRKYIVEPDSAERLVDELGSSLAVLEIEGRREFAYESVYFDTPGLESYHAAAHDRRRRFKVRTRTYVDSDDCVLEVKRRTGRGETVKLREPYDLRARDSLTAEGQAFVRSCLPGVDTDGLRPVLVTEYRRTTLVDHTGDSRLTLDTALVCSAPSGAAATLDGRVLIETKTNGSPTAADHRLWAAGVRPCGISKYCVGMAAVDPGLPANRWNRTLRRYFDWTPAPR
jgi:hypothetical protein